MLPPGTTLISLIDRNIASVGDSVAYRYLDYARSADGHAVETDLGPTLAVACGPSGRRCSSSPIAVTGWRSSPRRASTTSPDSSQRSRREPSRCRCSRRNCRATPSVWTRRFAMRRPPLVLTTAAASDAVLRLSAASFRSRRRPRVVVIDEIPDSAGAAFVPTRPRHRRRLPPAVHLGVDATAGRRRDHPSGGRHEPGTDDPVDRPTGPKHPRRQLVTALPRHGSVDDRLSGGVRRTLDPDVADRVHPSARSGGFMRCPPSRGTAAWSPPRRTSPTSGPHSVACPRQARTST